MNYDDFYRDNPKYFGNPFPELIEFFSRQPVRGKLLDVGCGQGRDAIPLAEMGYDVVAIDTSEIAVKQLNQKLRNKKWHLTLEQKDIESVNDLSFFDYILLDGFFHFNEHDKARDAEIIEFLKAQKSPNTKLVFCFANHSFSVRFFHDMVLYLNCLEETELIYRYTDPISELVSETNYYFGVFQ